MLDQPDVARCYARSSLKYFDAPRRAVGYGDFAWSCFCREQLPEERPRCDARCFRTAATGPREHASGLLDGTLARGPAAPRTCYSPRTQIAVEWPQSAWAFRSRSLFGWCSL